MCWRSLRRSCFCHEDTFGPKTARLHPLLPKLVRRTRDASDQLKGDVHLTYEPSGFVYAFDVPLVSLTAIASE